MFRAEERLELDARRIVQQVNGGIAPAVVAGVIGDQSDAQPFERREVLFHQHVNAVESCELGNCRFTGRS